jgi:hypothetical protein
MNKSALQHTLSIIVYTMTIMSVFQLYPNSPHISVKDVQHAFRKTRRMTPHQRIKYFHKHGMHYSHCVKYINVVDNLQKLYDNDHIVIEQQPQQEESTMSIQQIGQFIEELLKDLDES